VSGTIAEREAPCRFAFDRSSKPSEVSERGHLVVDCLLVDHGTIVRQTGEMIGKLAESFCGLFSAVYGENGLGGDCRASGVFSSDMGVSG